MTRSKFDSKPEDTGRLNAVELRALVLQTEQSVMRARAALAVVRSPRRSTFAKTAPALILPKPSRPAVRKVPPLPPRYDAPDSKPPSVAPVRAIAPRPAPVRAIAPRPAPARAIATRDVLAPAPAPVVASPRVILLTALPVVDLAPADVELVEAEIDVDLSRIEPTARTRVRDVVDFEANVLGRGYFKRRFRALFVIALLVVARPWWWNIADARSASGVPAQTIGADVTARAAYVADGPRR